MTPEILEVVRLLDELYATRIQELSPVVVDKYNPSYFSSASAKTVRFYLTVVAFSARLAGLMR